MIDQQAGMVVDLAMALGEVLQGRESAHSLRLLDLEQRRDELRRRNRAAVNSMLSRSSGVDEIPWTMEALDLSAASLLRTVHRFHPLWSVPDEATRQMVAVIRQATASLQQGYSRLANGSPAAELDADAAIGSKMLLIRYRDPAFKAMRDAGAGRYSTPQDQLVQLPPQASDDPAGWLCDLYDNLNGITQELAGAGVILKRWSRRLTAGRHGDSGGASGAWSPASPARLS
ncbi:hypothetical protein [Candidatus Accumulibacter aalborgensis]|nr:hypothetical protein [Candidatus Accumulibacter aalborgensis]